MLILLGSFSVVLLLILSAFWAGSETALTSLSKYRIKKIIALKKNLAVALVEWLKTPYYYLTTILVGNTVTNMALSFLSTIVLIEVCTPYRIFHLTAGREIIEFVNWLIITFLILVFGEVTPKIFGRHYPERVTMFSLPVLSRILSVSKPVAIPLLKLVKLLFPKTELLPISRLQSLTFEDVKDLISEANTTGTIGKETTQMIESFLKLSGLKVEKIMLPMDKVEAVNIDQDEELFMDLIVESGRSRVPVFRGSMDNIAGFVHTKDLLWAWGNNKGNFSEDLVRPPYFVPKEKSIYELLKEFQAGKTHMAFVKDESGKFLGIVTLEDILEEIVGEILDEYDIGENG